MSDTEREAAAIEAAAEVLIGTLGISPDSPPFIALATATVRAYLEAIASQPAPVIACGGPAPPQTFHYGPHPACPECGMGGDVGADTPNPIPF